ncbi:MAG: BrnA antitoxin family protein, partial [Caulobacteraceae bacterium]|nr:BrnA antitoxin family protein [Caulobacteraceae bacterium]
WNAVSDNPALTEAELATGKPFAEAFPEAAATLRPVRGKQKAPTKELISLRLDRDTLDAFRSTGPGWQARINAALRKATPAAPKR